MSDGSQVGVFCLFVFYLFIFGLGFFFFVCFTSLPLKLLSMLCSPHTKKAPDLHPSQEDRHHGPTRTRIHRASARLKVRLACGPHGPPSPGRGESIASLPFQRLLTSIVSVASALYVIFFLLLAFYSIISAIIIVCAITFWRMKQSGTTRCQGA